MPRDDYSIFSDLAARLGFEEQFTENRNPEQWLRHLYDESRPRALQEGIELPPFDEFWEQGKLEFERPATPQIFLEAFRRDPQQHPLSTPSGKIELYSETIAAFGYRG